LAKLYYFQKWHGRRGLLVAAAQMAPECLIKVFHDGITRDHSERIKGYLMLLRALGLSVAEGPITAQQRLVRRD
jgi:hypothetical protein